jgi:hypothetical protein
MVVHDGPNTPIAGPIRSISPEPPPSASRPGYLRSTAAAYAPASDYASTMVVTPSVEHRGGFSEDNDSYMAALRAAGADVRGASSGVGEDDSYMAALKSAAADGERDRRPSSQQHSPMNPPSTYRRCAAAKYPNPAACCGHGGTLWHQVLLQTPAPGCSRNHRHRAHGPAAHEAGMLALSAHPTACS